jgi:predicted heme/steroid binding protein
VQRVFTSEELAAYDGSVSGRPVLIGYEGYVYDVTGRFMWMAGRHFWLRAGRDLTGRMTDSPHGEEILSPRGLFPSVPYGPNYPGETGV